MLLGGMMTGKADIPPLLGRFRSLANFTYAAKLMARYASDRLRYPRGTRLMMGNALVRKMAALQVMRNRVVEILFSAPLAAVDEQNGRVAGATVKTADGEIYVKAAVCVSHELYGRWLAQQALPRSVHAASGAGALDGERISTSVIQYRHWRNSSAPGSRWTGTIAAAGCGRWRPFALRYARTDGSKGLYLHSPGFRPRQTGRDRGGMPRASASSTKWFSGTTTSVEGMPYDAKPTGRRCRRFPHI